MMLNRLASRLPNPLGQTSAIEKDGPLEARSDGTSGRSGTFASTAPSQPNWTAIVEGVRAGDAASMAELYRVLSKGIRLLICRQLGLEDLDDRVHEVFVIIVEAIQRGSLRDPERLMGFVRTVVIRQIGQQIKSRVRTRKQYANPEVIVCIRDARGTPEQQLGRQERVELMSAVLNEMSPRDREVLSRFYLHEETQQGICREMGLTETQFRLLKSRAKARFADLGQKKLHVGLESRIQSAAAATTVA